MNKKASANKVLFSFIIILIIALIGIIVFFMNSQNSNDVIYPESQSPINQEQITTPVSECDNLEEGISKWRCYDDLAEEERSLEICNKISRENYKWGCYYSVAMVKHSMNICNQIEEEYQKEQCIRDIDKWKTTKCELDRYPEDQANCLMKVAIANDNLEGCEEIEIQSYKDSCIKHITLNLQEK